MDILPTCQAPTTGAAGQIFTSAFQFFAASQCMLSDSWRRDAKVVDGQHFDFIVVGGGTAGSVVASRLSECRSCKVLLIEAGGYPPVESRVPALSGRLFKSKYDWQYVTKIRRLKNKGSKFESVNWPSGKMLGGCSSINDMIYLRGSTFDYQRWYDEGNKNWHPALVRDYFLKAENLQSETLLKNPFTNVQYGKKGPLVINRFNSTYSDVTRQVLKSWDEIGFKTVPDLNSANIMGSGIYTATAADGLRKDTATSYLRVKRKNLKIITDTLVLKVLINIKTEKAYGVQVERNGTILIFMADKEVIVSAGSVNTPQLLMLSGLGPKEHLESKRIKTIVDLPQVGLNLKDHLIVPVTIFGNNPGPLDTAKQHLESIKYLYNRSGYLANSNLADVVTFYSLNKTASYPDFQVHLSIFNQNSPTLRSNLATVGRYSDSIIDSLERQNAKKTLYMFLFTLLRPYSNGTIKLASRNPKDHALIKANYFADRRDIANTVRGIKMLTKIVNTTYFRSIDGELGRIDWGPCNSFALGSNAYWRCISLDLVRTIYNPMGSARMGTNKNVAVVNSRLQVFGVDNLRVVDASVAPAPISSNTNGPVIMIAEMASDMIKKDYYIYNN